MRDDHKKITGKPRPCAQGRGKLYGIGLGPGDPGLLTLRAKEILNKVDVVFVPKSKDGAISCARSIVETAISKPKNFVELTFPMTRDRKILASYWLRAAERIAKELKSERTAAFVTIGDPFIYSTYIYLLETLRNNFPGIATETVPGISAFNAAAASCGVPLVKGNEKLAVLPVTRDIKRLRATLEKFDTVILMKVGSRLESIVRLLKKMKLIKNSVLVSHAGQPGEKIVKDLSLLRDKRAGYLSVIIVRKKDG